MKLKQSNSRALRYGGVTALLTVLILVAVILFNVIFSALAERFLWYVDLTPELLFTLSDECVDMIGEGSDAHETSERSPTQMIDQYRAEARAANPDFKDEDMKIQIIFCDEKDVWEQTDYYNYVHETAAQLQKEFPDYIDITYRDIIRNPSSVSKYGQVVQNSVIIEFGSEYRVRNLNAFYVFDDTDTSTSSAHWAYNGEKMFTAAIFAVTRTESPVACLTVNHNEGWVQAQNDQLLVTLDNAGYQVKTIDLEKEEIPENCRLLIIMDPQTDFHENDGISTVDEIGKLETFLEGSNALMVFLSPDTDPLPKLESFLGEWGISFDRKTEGADTLSYMITDPSQSYYGNGGYTIEGEYVTTGQGSALTADLRKNASTLPAVVFQNAMSISYSESYQVTRYTDEDDASQSFDYGSTSAYGYTRSIYDVFVTSEHAVAMAGGSEVEKATAANPLKLMTLSVQERSIQETEYTTVAAESYVLACGSPEFAYNNVITNNAYGNNSFLEYALRELGQEGVPVGLTFKAFGDYTMDTVTTKEATQYTVVLTVVPMVIALGAGIFVIVRRKYR